MNMQFQSDRNDDNYDAYDTFSALDAKSAQRKNIYLIAAGAVGLLVILIAVAMFAGKGGNEALNERLSVIEKRLDDIEFRLGNLEQANMAGGDLASVREATDKLSKRFDQLETSLGQNLNQLEQKLSAFENKAASAASAKPVAAKPAPPKQTAPRMHTVKAGENLYQISRQYNISVEELRKLNGIGGDLIIKPGQQLKVSAP
jgi:LysM repeat protein